MKPILQDKYDYYSFLPLRHYHKKIIIIKEDAMFLSLVNFNTISLEWTLSQAQIATNGFPLEKMMKTSKVKSNE